MMAPQTANLAERRQRLVDNAAAQRIALLQNIEPLRKPLALADRGLNALRYVRSHPALLLLGALAFAVLRPGRIGAKLRRAWVALQFIRNLRSL
jgi:YqjK-like protein